MSDPALAIEYGELEDALGWIVEAPFRLGAKPNAESSGHDVIAAAAKQLQVDLHHLGEFGVLGLTRVLSGNYGLSADLINELLGAHEKELLILIGVAASRGKCPGP